MKAIIARIPHVSTAANSTPPPGGAGSGRTRQKLRTRRDLLATAGRLISEGHRPTVAEVADAADVSRRTAYRYFPTQEKLLVEASLERVRPAMEAAITAAPAGLAEADLDKRLDTLVRSMQTTASEHEHLLRTMVHLTVLEKPQPGTRPRGSRRVDWIELAVGSLKPRLDRAAYSRLVTALSLIVGIEALIVMRDLRGLGTSQSIQVSQWMARAVLRETVRGAAEKAAPALPDRRSARVKRSGKP
jgi:AcrR family transcriptional regulator